MALKPRKQRKHYPYLFLLNEKTFLKYLRGQYVIFDSFNFPYYDDCTARFPIDNLIDYYEFSQTKQKIFEGGCLFEKIDLLVNKLTDENKLDYAPIFCSSWVVKNDNEAIKKQEAVINEKGTDCYQKSKAKREARKQLRLNTWCCGWMDFELNKSIEDLELDHTMLSHRERKWWQKGYNDAKEDMAILNN